MPARDAVRLRRSMAAAPRPTGFPAAPMASATVAHAPVLLCGDGVLDLDAGEQCDDGPFNGLAPFGCRPDCQLYSCGDGVLDQVALPDGGLYGEACDLGPQNGLGLGCNSTCSLTGSAMLVAGKSGESGYADSAGAFGLLFALFNQPYGLAVSGGLLYVADEGNGLIRQVDLAAQSVLTLAGQAVGPGAGQTLDGFGRDAGFYQPSALALTNLNTLLVAEYGAVRRLDLTTTQVLTLAGQPCSGAAFATCVGNQAGCFGSAAAGDAGPTFTGLSGLVFDPGSQTCSPPSPGCSARACVPSASPKPAPGSPPTPGPPRPRPSPSSTEARSSWSTPARLQITSGRWTCSPGRRSTSRRVARAAARPRRRGHLVQRLLRGQGNVHAPRRPQPALGGWDDGRPESSWPTPTTAPSGSSTRSPSRSPCSPAKVRRRPASPTASAAGRASSLPTPVPWLPVGSRSS